MAMQKVIFELLQARKSAYYGAVNNDIWPAKSLSGPRSQCKQYGAPVLNGGTRPLKE
jgi:hypothetical protein